MRRTPAENVEEYLKMAPVDARLALERASQDG
jgi:hypothetical protein